MRRFTLSLATLIVATVCCQPDLEQQTELAPLDEAFFRCRVQPLLTKSCGAYACHGTDTRYFRVFGRNRLRIDRAPDALGLTLTTTERAYNYNSARAQVNLDDPSASVLLLKPLDETAGGYYHGGAEIYRHGDVYLSRDDIDFKLIEQWIDGETTDPDCIEPGSEN